MNDIAQNDTWLAAFGNILDVILGSIMLGLAVCSLVALVVVVTNAVKDGLKTWSRRPSIKEQLAHAH